MSSVRIALVALASILAVAPFARAADAATGQDVLHEVRAGDNLHLIAGYYYGDARQWERIWQANRELVSNPNQVEQGTWLRIPDAEIPVEAYADFLGRMGDVAAVATPGPGPDGPRPAVVLPAVPLTPVSAEAPASAATPPPAGPSRQ